MFRITRTANQTVVNMAGCGKQSDYYCGIRAKMG